MRNPPLAIRVEILPELLADRRISRDAIKDAKTDRHNLLLVDGDALDHKGRMLCEKVTLRPCLVRIATRHRQPKKRSYAQSDGSAASGY